MRIVVVIGHPAHVHFFKYAIEILKSKGHEVLVATVDKDVAINLLKYYEVSYYVLGRRKKGIVNKITFQLKALFGLCRISKTFKADLFIAIGSTVAAQTAYLLRKQVIIFDDSEPAALGQLLYKPFASAILTPLCFRKCLGHKHIRYNGFHELAYLHPNYFKPDLSVLTKLGLMPGDTYSIVRFVSWGASHDIGHHGFSLDEKHFLVTELSKYGKVFISSEGSLPDEFLKYQIKVPPEKMHDLLYYARLYIGEGATMATEAAILGTPAIYVSTLAGTMGNFIELEKKYDLMYSYRDPEKAINKAVELIQNQDAKNQWTKKRERLFSDKIDVTKFMVDFIERWPQSFKELTDRQENK